MTVSTRPVRRRPHPLLTVLGMTVALLLIGAAGWTVGFCLAWVSDVVFGVKP